MRLIILLSAVSLFSGCTISAQLEPGKKVELTRKEAAAALKQRDQLIELLAQRVAKLEKEVLK